jgi:hypothetical protein
MELVDLWLFGNSVCEHASTTRYGCHWESWLGRHLRMIALGVLVAALLPAVILLLPILLPALVAADAWETRRLARTRCAACGATVGRAEIQRAKLEARARG